MTVSFTPVAMARRVVQIASRQHGIIDFVELVELEMAPSTISGWARSGHLHRIHEGVYSVVPPSMLTLEGRWLAAVKACGEGAALSHAPAGQLLGIVPRRERHALHVTVPDRSRRRIPGVVIHRPRHLELRDVTKRFAIPVTTATRTIWDVAFALPSGATRRAFEKAESSGLLNRDRLVDLAAASPSRKGSGLIRALLLDRPVPLAAVRSWLEALLLTICVDHSLPFPAVNVPLLGYEVDFLWESARFVAEADGGDHMEKRQRDKDNARDFELQRAGFLVRRYSSRDMARESNVVREVLEILRERSPQVIIGAALP